MHDGFICDACGFTSIEEVGTGKYTCPKCGSQMRRAKQNGMFGGGDANPSAGAFALDILYIVFVGGLSFGVMNYISYWTDDFRDIVLLVLWFVLFVVSLVYFHKFISGPDKDKAIRKD